MYLMGNRVLHSFVLFEVHSLEEAYVHAVQNMPRTLGITGSRPPPSKYPHKRSSSELISYGHLILAEATIKLAWE